MSSSASNVEKTYIGRIHDSFVGKPGIEAIDAINDNFRKIFYHIAVNSSKPPKSLRKIQFIALQEQIQDESPVDGTPTLEQTNTLKTEAAKVDKYEQQLGGKISKICEEFYSHMSAKEKTFCPEIAILNDLLHKGELSQLNSDALQQINSKLSTLLDKCQIFLQEERVNFEEGSPFILLIESNIKYLSQLIELVNKELKNRSQKEEGLIGIDAWIFSNDPKIAIRHKKLKTILNSCNPFPDKLFNRVCSIAVAVSEAEVKTLYVRLTRLVNFLNAGKITEEECIKGLENIENFVDINRVMKSKYRIALANIHQSIPADYQDGIDILEQLNPDNGRTSDYRQSLLSQLWTVAIGPERKANCPASFFNDVIDLLLLDEDSHTREIAEAIKLVLDTIPEKTALHEEPLQSLIKDLFNGIITPENFIAKSNLGNANSHPVELSKNLAEPVAVVSEPNIDAAEAESHDNESVEAARMVKGLENPEKTTHSYQTLPDHPLHYHADRANQKSAVKSAQRLIAAGKDVNAKDEQNETPLHYAAARGSKEMVELLLASGAKVNERNIDDRTALHYAVKGGHLDVVELLTKNGANAECLKSIIESLNTLSEILSGPELESFQHKRKIIPASSQSWEKFTDEQLLQLCRLAIEYDHEDNTTLFDNALQLLQLMASNDLRNTDEYKYLMQWKQVRESVEAAEEAASDNDSDFDDSNDSYTDSKAEAIISWKQLDTAMHTFYTSVQDSEFESEARYDALAAANELVQPLVSSNPQPSKNTHDTSNNKRKTFEEKMAAKTADKKLSTAWSVLKGAVRAVVGAAAAVFGAAGMAASVGGVPLSVGGSLLGFSPSLGIFSAGISLMVEGFSTIKDSVKKYNAADNRQEKLKQASRGLLTAAAQVEIEPVSDSSLIEQSKLVVADERCNKGVDFSDEPNKVDIKDEKGKEKEKEEEHTDAKGQHPDSQSQEANARVNHSAGDPNAKIGSNVAQKPDLNTIRDKSKARRKKNQLSAGSPQPSVKASQSPLVMYPIPKAGRSLSFDAEAQSTDSQQTILSSGRGYSHSK